MAITSKADMASHSSEEAMLHRDAEVTDSHNSAEAVMLHRDAEDTDSHSVADMHPRDAEDTDNSEEAMLHRDVEDTDSHSVRADSASSALPAMTQMLSTA